MKVYILFGYYNYEGSHILGVYQHESQAEKHKEEYELGDNPESYHGYYIESHDVQ